MHANALDQVLGTARLAKIEFVDAEVSGSRPVAMPMERATAACIFHCHLVVEGECIVVSETRSEIRLRAGDVILLPHRKVHAIRAAYMHSAQAQRAGTRLLCGTLSWEIDPFRPLIAALPEIIRCPGARGRSGSAISNLYRLCADEVRSDPSGLPTTRLRLGEALFSKIIFTHFELAAGDQDRGLAGLRDRRVSQAILLLQASPDREWTLDGLSREVGMSRSALADRFTRFVGTPPMHYLALWRMHLASSLILSDRGSIAEVAAEVGYESEAAFSRAFKKIVGCPPALWRRNRLRADAHPHMTGRQRAGSVLCLARAG